MGEDPFLAGELAAHMIKGMNGVGRNATLSDSTTVAPLVKHYAVYSIGERDPGSACLLVKPKVERTQSGHGELTRVAGTHCAQAAHVVVFDFSGPSGVVHTLG